MFLIENDVFIALNWIYIRHFLFDLMEYKAEMKVLHLSFTIFICLFFGITAFAVDNSFKLDFDGDGRTDIALYREGSRDIKIAPQPSYWYFLNTQTGQASAIQWGRSLDIPAPGDFDGDGITDVGIYRWWHFDIGDANDYWLRKSSGGYEVLTYEWDPSYDKFNRNYFGDARTEIAHLYRVNTSQNPNNPCNISIYFVADFLDNNVRKTVADVCNVVPIPIPGDYDNDGYSEIAVFTNRTFKVWFPPYTSIYTTPHISQFLDVDMPTPGDYDGDGKTDFAGTKGIAGRLIWRIIDSSTGNEREMDFGFATDKPVPGDYDGDGKTDIAIFRQSDASWWILNSGGGVSSFYFGYPTDTPLAMPVIPFNF